MHPPTFFLMDLLDLVLGMNYFHFGTDFFFLQMRGVAMGSTSVPSVANLFMEASEEHFFYVCVM